MNAYEGLGLILLGLAAPIWLAPVYLVGGPILSILRSSVVRSL